MKKILIPFLALLGISGALIALSMSLTGGEPPSVIQDESALGNPASQEDSYSLSQLLRRLPPEGLAQVDRYIEYFKKDRRRGLEDGLARSTKYLATIQKIFRKNGLPVELSYLPLIESGFVENATSPAAAVGVWQFTVETGRRFNLISNSWFDKRRDPITSTYAAARYLKSLFRQFGDWDLALAAYNSGAGTVRWALRKNKRANLPTHFWALSLPDETRNYLPAFIAAVLIAKNPEAYGFYNIRFHPRVTFERIKVSAGVSLSLLAEQLEIKKEDLYNLNPELIRGETPPTESHYMLRIPLGTRQHLPIKLTGRSSTLKDWVLHPVNASDTLQELASRFSAHPSHIMKVNSIQDNQDLASRDFVIIPL